MSYSYPMMLDVTRRLAVLVGGGAVATRKARGLLAAGATRLRCVAPNFHADFPAVSERLCERYQERHLDGASLAFAATDDPAVNDSVVRDAQRRGILVNRADADEAGAGDFSTPAVFSEGAVTITVSASSAALSAALRDDLAARIDRRFIRMADAMKLLRPALRGAAGVAPARRAEIFRELARPDALAALDAGGIDALRNWLRTRFPELQDF